jgi:hypothetical protein
MPIFVGNVAIIPAHRVGKGRTELRLDLLESKHLRFTLTSDDAGFVVSHDGLRALLEAYADTQRRMAAAAEAYDATI